MWFEGLEGETPDAPASQDKEEETEMSPDLEVQFFEGKHMKNGSNMIKL